MYSVNIFVTGNASSLNAAIIMVRLQKKKCQTMYELNNCLQQSIHSALGVASTALTRIHATFI